MSVPPPPNQPSGYPEQPPSQYAGGYSAVHTVQPQAPQQHYGHYQAYYQDPAYYQQQYQPAYQPPYDGFSITAVCIAAASIVATFTHLIVGGVMAVAAVIFGIVGIIQTAKRKRRGRGMAITGLAIGGGVVVIIMVLMFFVVAAFGLVFTTFVTQ